MGAIHRAVGGESRRFHFLSAHRLIASDFTAAASESDWLCSVFIVPLVAGCELPFSR